MSPLLPWTSLFNWMQVLRSNILRNRDQMWPDCRLLPATNFSSPFSFERNSFSFERRFGENMGNHLPSGNGQCSKSTCKDLQEAMLLLSYVVIIIHHLTSCLSPLEVLAWKILQDLSGWIALRLRKKSPQTHFLVLEPKICWFNYMYQRIKTNLKLSDIS